MKSTVYEMSYLLNVPFMKCPIYKMSFCEMSFYEMFQLAYFREKMRKFSFEFHKLFRKNEFSEKMRKLCESVVAVTINCAKNGILCPGSSALESI